MADKASSSDNLLMAAAAAAAARQEKASGNISCSRRELEAVKTALACILQDENPLPDDQHEAREAELSRKLHEGLLMESSDGAMKSPSPQGLDTKDLTIMSRLLNQVHHFMAEENRSEALMESGNIQKSERHSNHLHASVERDTVETVVEIAGAAAEAAAKAAATSTGKNLEVMEILLAKSEKNPLPGLKISVCHDKESCSSEVSEEESSRPYSIDKDLVKKIERQNRITHWVLGIMVVATAIWRFKMLSMILGVRKTVTNPFQALRDVLTEGFKGGNKEELNGAKAFQKARTVLPPLLGGEEKEITKKTEHSTSEDFKMSEGLMLSLDNILSVGKLSSSITEGDSPKE